MASNSSREGSRILPLASGATAVVALILTATAGAVQASETIRIAIGTQDTTINCATGGLVIRELKLLEKYLPHDGKYKDVKYDISWKNFTAGAPLTSEMVAHKLDFGAMATNFNLGLASPGLGTMVPEPMGAVFVAATVLIIRLRSEL